MESATTSDDLPECSRNPRKARLEEMRNWVDLPPDIMSIIYLKLGPIEVLLRTQWVCKTWQKLSYQPQLYRNVDMRQKNLGFDILKRHTFKMVKEAIDRSSGEMVEFALENFSGGELLRCIKSKCSSLKCLRFYQCDFRAKKLIKLANTLHQLEELEISFCGDGFSGLVLETFGQSCPQLKSFRLNTIGDRCSHCDSDALAIAKSMPGLHHLHLLGNNLTGEGLQAILDGCPHLKSIDLRKCFQVQVGYDLKRRNITYRDTFDSIDDYEYDYHDPDIDYSTDEDYEENYESYPYRPSSPDTPTP